MGFKIGQNSLEVCQTIIKNHQEISTIKLIVHPVEINWRQRYSKKQEKLKYILKSFEHSKPLKTQNYARSKFLKLKLKDLPKLEKNQVWSIVSKVKCFGGKFKHIPMMNFHVEEKSTKEILIALKYIAGGKKGVLLESGRFYHYYGNSLLNEKEWIKFMAEFLMPTILVSPRYIGHRLYKGHCTLRLTPDTQHKPKTPRVIKLIQ